MRNRFNKNDKFEYYPAINKYTEITIKVGKKPGTENPVPGAAFTKVQTKYRAGINYAVKIEKSLKYGKEKNNRNGR